MRALAFDQSPSHTGWASGDDLTPGAVECGTLEMSDYGNNDQMVMRDFRRDLHKMFQSLRPDIVFYEQVVINVQKRRINLPVVERQFDVIACIKYAALDYSIPAKRVLIGEWRKWFMGNGRANKDDALRECARRNIAVKNDHEAEAVGILDFGLAHASQIYRERMTKHE